MKIFSTNQVRELDQFTIEHEPITSIDLMERAAQALTFRYTDYFSYENPVLIFAGPGNNGGDALAVARMLLEKGYDVKTILISTGKLSADCETNRDRLLHFKPESLTVFLNDFQPFEIAQNSVIIEGLFGSGLTRPIGGIFEKAVNFINASNCKTVSIDIPSGLNGENNPDLNLPIIKADHTFSLQFPKLAYLFAENAIFTGKWEVLDIGILPEAINKTETNYLLLEETNIQKLLKPRSSFSHKGNFGHALIMAGSLGMAGASVLSAKAALRTGAGLVSVHGPGYNRTIVQTAIPEAIFVSDMHTEFISSVHDISKYDAIAVGPGIGCNSIITKMLTQLFEVLDKPCVIDADALNTISQNKNLLQKLPTNSILTPHPKEFERLFGKTKNSYDRMMLASKKAQDLQIIIVVKGHHTLIALPDGQLIFNSTGNSGMSTAGTGDVLTGMIVSLLAQGYKPENAATLAVYLHGLAGDKALQFQSVESMIATDIIGQIGNTFISFQ